MKVAIATDSNSAILQKDAKELGITVIPMPFMVDDVEYHEEIDITTEEFFKKIEAGGKVVTSQPSPDVVTETWDKLLEDHDEVVYIPMSSGLSGSCQTAMMLAEDYDGKVFVVNNQRICPTQRDSVLDAVTLANKGMSGAQIKAKLEEVKFESSIYIIVNTLDYLKRGGRITPAVYMIGNLLKLKPILSIHGEKLDAHATVRTWNQGKKVLINSMKNDMANLIKDEDPSHYVISIAYSDDIEVAKEFEKDLKEAFPGQEFKIGQLSLSVICHTGPGSLGFAVSKKID